MEEQRINAVIRKEPARLWCNLQMEIHMRASRIAAALSIIGWLSVAAYEPAQAAPVTPLSAAAKAHDSGTVQVRYGWGGGWRGGFGGWHGGWGPRGWGWGAGALAAGALIGAAAAAPYYGGYGYGGGYYPYYDEPAPYYGNGYGYGGYYPAYGYRAYPRPYYYGGGPYYGW
jgi:hypothetical protein